MSDQFTKPTAQLLALTHQQSHDSQYWLSHEFAHPVVISSVRVCVCALCFSEMCDIADQWQRDFDSMVEDMRRSSRAFLGFDVWEEWMKKTN